MISHDLRPLMGQPALALAPMAGITDKPMRQLVKQFGATWTVGEMLTSDPSLQQTRKSLQRRDHSGETGISVMQIAGSDPEQLAQAARLNVDNGAQVIDINMGCPAKKVCNVAAGSALLQNEILVEKILNAVVSAVDVPVTLKTRLGWCNENKNILTIAHMAEQAGIAALAIHGRTREQMYRGEASYDLIAQVKQEVNLPIWVNGDITSPQKAAAVLAQTGADGVMIGRGAQGQPWLFTDIGHYLQLGYLPEPMNFQAASETVLSHLTAIYAFYGEHGVKIARKHIGWYLQRLPESENVRQAANACTNTAEQYRLLAAFFRQQADKMAFWVRDYA
ncbi:MAG: tRNA dihydrouridine synthase DusB [Alysiella sp.]|uniref:tRNA dihydrouridine synthase DusB n=1 Tax=Alysiella sp. TaxID=1872483 RepID=UPI0026DA874C|nr:tRNA dihydrouridine synthase DusB [Alysiella sp.]MDO4434691.1 tRNA dihydrouridine synthase DusB [Alysiella sp.]